MPAVELQGLEGIIKTLDGLGKLPRSLSAATNKTADHVRTQATRSVTDVWALKASDLRPLFKIDRATASSPEARISIKSESIPLLKFNAKALAARGRCPARKGAKKVVPRGRGVAYKLRKNVTGRLPHAFIATVGTGGHVGVFQRKTGRRLPIVELTTITPTSMLKQKLDSVLANAAPFFRRQVESQLERVLAGK